MFTEDDLVVTAVRPERVLLAVDDDDDVSSRRAFYYACTITRATGLPLALASVLETGDMSIYQSLSPDVINKRRSEIVDHLNTYQKKAIDFGVKNIVQLISEGKPEHVLLDELIPKFNPDLIVVGSHHKRVGHVAASVGERAKPSVIMVR